MAAQKGILFLLKEGAVSGTPTTIAGGRTVSMTVNNEQVDVTTQSSANARTLLADAGVQSISIDMSGVFEDETIEETVRGYAFANSINTFSLYFPNGDTLEASFAISNYSRSAEYNGAEEFSMTLESSGAITYTTA
jgi:TP901-1 family phage major tail protein